VDVLQSIDAQGVVLLVLPAPAEVLNKSFRNLQHVQIAYPGNLGTYEVLAADWVVFTRDAVEAMR
jgi:ribosomal protein L4